MIGAEDLYECPNGHPFPIMHTVVCAHAGCGSRVVVEPVARGMAMYEEIKRLRTEIFHLEAKLEARSILMASLETERDDLQAEYDELRHRMDGLEK